MFVRWIWAIPSGRASAPISAALRFPLQSLSPPFAALTARSACPPGLTGRAEVPDAVPGIRRSVLAHRASRNARRVAFRSRVTLRCTGRCTSRLAGAGFARHRAAHRTAHLRPHKCGRHCRRLRQRASRDCLRRCPQCPPLKRRGGSDLPASPASIPPSLSRSICRSLPPGAAFFSHLTHR